MLFRRLRVEDVRAPETATDRTAAGFAAGIRPWDRRDHERRRRRRGVLRRLVRDRDLRSAGATAVITPSTRSGQYWPRRGRRCERRTRRRRGTAVPLRGGRLRPARRARGPRARERRGPKVLRALDRGDPDARPRRPSYRRSPGISNVNEAQRSASPRPNRGPRPCGRLDQPGASRGAAGGPAVLPVRCATLSGASCPESP